MDRVINYPGAIPLETDLLNTNRSTMIALGKLARAMFGTGGVVNGLAVSPQSPATLFVNVGQGEIYQLENVDSTAYSSLPADTTDQIVKQGIQLGTAALSCPAPSTAGYSINYLIEAAYQDADINPVVLPYYNASNPSQAYSGPNNTGASNTTTRAGQVELVAKAGIAATTGTQTTPAVDAGYIALAVVTVANGQTQINAGNIAAIVSPQILSAPMANQKGRLLGITVITASGSFTPNPLATTTIVEGSGAGAAGGGTQATGSSTVSVGSGGSCGAYAKVLISGPITGPVACTIGAGGTGVVGAAGNAGGTTSFGSYLSCPGGAGGVASTATAPPFIGTGISGSNSAPTISGATTILSFPGVAGGGAFGLALSSSGVSGGRGYSNPLGLPLGAGYGSGGSGGAIWASMSATAGISGLPGVLIVKEYA